MNGEDLEVVAAFAALIGLAAIGCAIVIAAGLTYARAHSAFGWGGVAALSFGIGAVLLIGAQILYNYTDGPMNI